MKSKSSYFCRFYQMVLLMGVDPCGAVFAVESPKPPTAIPYVTRLEDLKASLNLPLEEETEMVRPSLSVMLKRAEADLSEGSDIEPLQVKVPIREAELREFARQNARISKVKQLEAYLKKRISLSYDANEVSFGLRRIRIDRKGLRLFEINKLADLLEKPHRKISLTSVLLSHQPTVTKKFVAQLSPFFTEAQQKEILSKINRGDSVSLDHDLLPGFARRMVGRFTPFRGPNCFHAALSFQGENIPKSSYINVRAEEGYHRAMINYDELWRILQAGFYEIDARANPLRYGDLLVFFDLPANPEDFTFRSIRHAATYLFGSYTFSKGSKSPDTPYTVKTIGDEWTVWRELSRNLGLKVYRRSSKGATTIPPFELVDWIY